MHIFGMKKQNHTNISITTTSGKHYCQYGIRRNNLYEKIPNWISPVEAFSHPPSLKVGRPIRYGDILNKDGNLKSKQEMQLQYKYLDWWTRVQRESRYSKDSSMGFYREQTKFDQIWLESPLKLIKKICMYLLEIKTEDETVKDCMVKWAHNLGYNIQLEDW